MPLIVVFTVEHGFYGGEGKGRGMFVRGMGTPRFREAF
jgi:hypothetical protein